MGGCDEWDARGVQRWWLSACSSNAGGGLAQCRAGNALRQPSVFLQSTRVPSCCHHSSLAVGPNDKFGGNGSILSVHQTGCGGCGGGVTQQQQAAEQAAGSNSSSACQELPSGAARQAGRSYPSRGGLLAAEAVDLLQRFYAAGNPNAPAPQRPVRERPAVPAALAGPAAMQLG